MISLQEVISNVYLYYPIDLSFFSPEYQSSKQYLKQLKKRKKACKDIHYKKYLYTNLVYIFKGYEVVDFSLLEEYNCYEYRILLHKNQPILDNDICLMKVLEDRRVDLFLYISVLEKYYYLFINRTEFDPQTGEWYFENIHDLPQDIELEIKGLKIFLNLMEYNELTTEIVQTRINNIETELKPSNETRVFDCYFSDLTGL